MGQRSASLEGRRHTPEPVARKLREADRLLGEGFEVPDVLKELEVSGTYHRWGAQYGVMKAYDDVARLKEPEAENANLQRIVADQLLGIERSSSCRGDGCKSSSRRGRSSLGGSLPVGDGSFVGGLGVLGELPFDRASLVGIDGHMGSAAPASRVAALSSMVRIFLASAVGSV
jgi:hypothetical protein